MSNWHIKLASRCVTSGGIIAYPTESVYGLGCNPWDIAAVRRILALKRRRPDKGLIIVAASVDQLQPFIDTTQAIPWDSVLASWPGPVTWVLPAKKQVPTLLRGVHGGMAVRVSAHPIVQELCQSAGLLVSTSANPEGRSPAKSAFRVRAYFGDGLDYILTGPTGGSPGPTAIRDALSGRVIRTVQK